MNFPPFLFVAIRQVIAGLILIIALPLFSKVEWPSIKYFYHQAIAGFFLITLGNGLVAWSEMHIPSGIAAVICSLMPVMVVVVNLTISRDERPNIPIVVGIALGFIGISMIFGEDLNSFTNSGYVKGMVLTLLAVISWAGGSVWIKRHNQKTNVFFNAGLQMFFGGLWSFPLSFAFDDLSTVHWSGEAFFALLYLIVFGSVIAYSCYSFALRNLPMTIVSLYAYINPLVAVILGWLVLDEKLNTTMGIAIIMTVAGIYIVNRGYQLRDVWKAQFSR
ncbi:MAG TPA: EamA family transporter, partial [Cyclobacteriaceae bacterium]|nr:EamA family transporter [Cyclobacteriaceae bacterium]